MTRQETGIIMDILTAAYPRFYATGNVDMRNTVNLWADMFKEEPLEVVAAAVKALIATDEKGFPPHIGAVKAKIRTITTPKEMTEAEAWGLIAKAVSNSAYNSKQEFEKLPENLQRLVGTPQQLKEWSMIDSDQLQTVVASNFQRSYRARATQEKEYAALPSDVKALMGEMGTKLFLENQGACAPMPDGKADQRAREDMKRMREFLKREEENA